MGYEYMAREREKKKGAYTQEIAMCVDCEDENKNSNNDYDDLIYIHTVCKVIVLTKKQNLHISLLL